MAKNISPKTARRLLKMQQDEMDSYEIYRRVARRLDGTNRDLMEKIAEDELEHAFIWSKYTGIVLKGRMWKVHLMVFLSRILGFTFITRYLERGEHHAIVRYLSLESEIPEAVTVRLDEESHELMLIGALDEKRLRYVGSMVLGLNDALVELTGTLVGFTFALRDAWLVALSGLIAGLAAAFSMASSAYLSARADGNKDSRACALYTGVMYLIVVALLVLPYMLVPRESSLTALGIMLLIVVAIITVFNYYLAVAKNQPFKRRFLEMFVVCLVITLLSFGFGTLGKFLISG
ncbi:MAG: VIT1/CCC1 family protein [Fibrobacter sp.]|jgi:VIT1/CCC1 family predicted Fe2+/Mn2+ transporter|nr:VIT1/CCC1 family protein [Fibrobacter sp.]